VVAAPAAGEDLVHATRADSTTRGGRVDREQLLAGLILGGSAVVLVLWAVLII
jgi:hypothetical protein